jgi:maltose alpha-D-glucosyltransferase/alpha-amylase
MGVSGFRVDAAPFVLEQVAAGVDPGPMDFSILDDWRQDVQWRTGDAVILCEANVSPADVPKYTGTTVDGPNDRSHMLFSFLLNARLWLALARQQAEPIIESLTNLPALQDMAQWATFLRNHDELDLSRLTDQQRADVFRSFAPKVDMQLYGRGIRRRLAPMLGGDRRHIELAYSLQFAMPGTPVIRYGEEIGMGEDLTLPGRDSLRTPMQWDDRPNGGFSTAPADGLVAPLAMTGKFGARRVNVRTQQREPESLLRWFEQLIGTVRECPEIGVGTWSLLPVPGIPSVLAHKFEAPEGTILLLHNLADNPVTVDIGPQPEAERPWEMFADGPYRRPDARLKGLELRGWGYRWIRLRRSAAG